MGEEVVDEISMILHVSSTLLSPRKLKKKAFDVKTLTHSDSVRVTVGEARDIHTWSVKLARSF